jgi:ribonucleotide reductase beta subunit family protein with ferritin-like domain
VIINSLLNAFRLKKKKKIITFIVNKAFKTFNSDNAPKLQIFDTILETCLDLSKYYMTKSTKTKCS